MSATIVPGNIGFLHARRSEEASARSLGRAEATPPELTRVAHLTVARMEGTYADFLAAGRGYERLPDFFKNHLYAPPDRARRNRSLERLHEGLSATVGREMASGIDSLIELIRITDELDLATARALDAADLPSAPNRPALEEAIRAVGRWEERRRQIALAHEALAFFFSLTKLPLYSLVVAPIKAMMSVLGAQSLVDTMNAGYELSRAIGDLRPFLAAFREREFALIAAWEAAATPYAIDGRSF